jgi:hypothetical protein
MPKDGARPNAHRRPKLASWQDSLAPEDRVTAARWIKEAGREAFDRIATAYAEAPRAKGRLEVDDTRLLGEMAHLLVRHPNWRIHQAAWEVAKRVIKENDWGDRPIRPTEKSLREKLKRDFAKRPVELMRQARGEAQRRECARAPIRAAYGAGRAGPFSSQVARAIDEAVRSAQRTLDRLPRWMRDGTFMRQLELLEHEAKLRAITAGPGTNRVSEEVDRLLRDLDLTDP